MIVDTMEQERIKIEDLKNILKRNGILDKESAIKTALQVKVENLTYGRTVSVAGLLFIAD